MHFIAGHALKAAPSWGGLGTDARSRTSACNHAHAHLCPRHTLHGTRRIHTHTCSSSACVRRLRTRPQGNLHRRGPLPRLSSLHLGLQLYIGRQTTASATYCGRA